jgi:hypothetical protein
MTKVKVEKILVISFIGLIAIFFAGLGGNLILKAGLPVSLKKTQINFEKRLQTLEDDLASGLITRHEYDSVTDLLKVQVAQSKALQSDDQIPNRIPDWVVKLGINEPDGLTFDPVFSDFTSVNNPTEGFNSVSLVYNGSYDKAVEEATKIAATAKLSVGGVFIAKGNPVKTVLPDKNSGICYMNYSLGNTSQNFLISVQVEPSGRLTIMVTDNKQLNDCLLAYEPLNNRHNSTAKQKKQ